MKSDMATMNATTRKTNGVHFITKLNCNVQPSKFLDFGLANDPDHIYSMSMQCCVIKLYWHTKWKPDMVTI